MQVLSHELKLLGMCRNSVSGSFWQLLMEFDAYCLTVATLDTLMDTANFDPACDC